MFELLHADGCTTNLGVLGAGCNCGAKGQLEADRKAVAEVERRLQLLVDTLGDLLVKIGVLKNDVQPNAQELIMLAELVERDHRKGDKLVEKTAEKLWLLRKVAMPDKRGWDKLSPTAKEYYLDAAGDILSDPSIIEVEAVLNAVTFDNVRPKLDSEYSDDALRAVLIRVRKLIRQVIGEKGLARP